MGCKDRGTSCGPYTDKRLHPARWQRPQLGSDRQSGAGADGQAPEPVPFPARHARQAAAVFPREAVRSAPCDADAQRPVTPPVPRRPPSSGRCPASKPRLPTSRFAAAAGCKIHLVQQGRNFFWMAMIASAWSGRHGSGAAQGGNLAIGLGKIGLQRVGWSLFRPARAWLKRPQRAGFALPPPVAQGRGIQPLPTKNG